MKVVDIEKKCGKKMYFFWVTHVIEWNFQNIFFTIMSNLCCVCLD